ncbi:hypothetical protein L1887_53662 [Cichorium endivia]|nr:hypothetical protein L1887_53662 [Cichorium endivia]
MLLARELVEHRDDRGRRRRVDDRTRNHRERILGVQTGIVLVVSIEHSDTASVHVAAHVRDAQVLLQRHLLHTLHEPVALVLVRTRTPVVAQIIQQLHLPVKVVGEARREALGKHDERVHGAAQRALEEDHAWIRQRHTEQHDQMLHARRHGAHRRKQPRVRLLGADLVDLALRAAVDQQDPLLGSEVGEQAVVLERNVHALGTDEHAPLRVGRLAEAVDVVVDKQLEEEEEEVAARADVVEDGGAHELVRIRAEAVDEVVVVEHVDHGHLRDGLGERAAAEPLAVVVKHVAVDARADFVGEGHGHALLGVALVVPLLHLGLAHELVAVDLIAATDDGVVGLGGVRLEQVVPQRVGTVELGLVDAGAEAVAAVSGPAEVLRLGGHEEGVSGEALDRLGLRVGVSLAVDRIVHGELVVGHGDLDLEAPKGERALGAVVLVQLDGLRRGMRVVLGHGGGAIRGGRRDGRGVLPAQLHCRHDRVVAGGILGDDHGECMVEVVAHVDRVVAEHGPRAHVERRHDLLGLLTVGRCL